VCKGSCVLDVASTGVDVVVQTTIVMQPKDLSLVVITSRGASGRLCTSSTDLHADTPLAYIRKIFNTTEGVVEPYIMSQLRSPHPRRNNVRTPPHNFSVLYSASS
jgi:hypothetical protein